MKITQEGPGRMVLKDYNTSHFVMGLVFAVVGIGLIAFIGSPEQMVTYVIGGVFALAGLWILATTKIINITLDKTGPCRFSMKKLTGGESSECSAGDIKELKLEKTYKTSGKGGTRYQYAIDFVLKGGRELRFEFGTVSAGIMDVMRSPHEKKREQAKQIADFLGVPLKETGLPSTAETLGMMKGTIQEQMEKARKERI
jgi:hypothetical protein